MKAIEKGCERVIIIARNGRPVAKLVPMESQHAGRRIGVARGTARHLRSYHVAGVGPNCRLAARQVGAREAILIAPGPTSGTTAHALRNEDRRIRSRDVVAVYQMDMLIESEDVLQSMNAIAVLCRRCCDMRTSAGVEPAVAAGRGRRTGWLM